MMLSNVSPGSMGRNLSKLASLVLFSSLLMKVDIVSVLS